MATAQERLQKVQDAIDAIVVGNLAEYSIADRRAKMLELDQLRALEKDLQSQVGAESGEDPINYTQFTDGSAAVDS